MNDEEVALRVHRLLVALVSNFDAVVAEVDGGIVYLEGLAATATERQKIEQAIGRVPGVKQVINCLSTERLAHLDDAGVVAFNDFGLHQTSGPLLGSNNA